MTRMEQIVSGTPKAAMDHHGGSRYVSRLWQEQIDELRRFLAVANTLLRRNRQQFSDVAIHLSPPTASPVRPLSTSRSRRRTGSRRARSGYVGFRSAARRRSSASPDTSPR